MKRLDSVYINAMMWPVKIGSEEERKHPHETIER